MVVTKRVELGGKELGPRVMSITKCQGMEHTTGVKEALILTEILGQRFYAPCLLVLLKRVLRKTHALRNGFQVAVVIQFEFGKCPCMMLISLKRAVIGRHSVLASFSDLLSI